MWFNAMVSLLQRSIGSSLLVGLIACTRPPQSSEPSFRPEAALSVLDFGITKVSEVHKQKTHFTVHLQGKIGPQAPLLGQRAYELQDSTGSIWVVTREPIPASGTQVKVTGKVRYQQILLDGKDQGAVYVEQQGATELLPANQTLKQTQRNSETEKKLAS